MDTFTTGIKVFAASQIETLAELRSQRDAVAAGSAISTALPAYIPGVAPLHLIRAKIEAAGFGALLS